MPARLPQFTLAGTPYFDVPGRSGERRQRHFFLRAGIDWSDWTRFDMPGWTGRHPAGLRLPPQGWKIHVSATLETAQEVLDKVSGYAAANRLSFKFIPSREELVERNAKQADRGSAGKFITVYPSDEEELRAALLGLDELVGGMPGPYILSDLRWAEGPLYVRYGAFQLRSLREEDGEEVHAILAPDGRLVPDPRDAAFTPPSWVELPAILRQQLDRLGSGEAPADFPYRFSDALQFSNGGGTYHAVSTSRGERVVIKEARPFAGLTPDGRDAVQRLDAEKAALHRLASDPAVVGLRDVLQLEGHRFLVLDEVDGTTLNKAVVQRTPIVRADSDVADYLDYQAWALDIADQVEAVITRIHHAGLVYGDLHPANVMITPEGRAVLIDFEMARPSEVMAPSVIAAAGFGPPADLQGVEADLYSLACLKLFLFLPLTTLFALDRSKAEELITAAGRLFLLPQAFLDDLRARLVPTGTEPDGLSGIALLARRMRDAWRVEREDELAGLEVLIGRSIDQSADFSRSDRSYPGDLRQFTENGYALAHGAAGVINALDGAGLEVSPLAWQWLGGAMTSPHSGRQLGLYNGLAGAGWLQRRVGRDSSADQILQRVLDGIEDALGDHPVSRLSPGIYGGLAGIGLYLLSEPAAFDGLLERVARELESRVDSGEASFDREGRPRRGLMWGPSGIALFAGRLYGRTGDERHLALARRALQVDLDQCVPAADGSVQMDEGWRLMPYLATGSAGCALVAAQLIPFLPDPEPYLAAIRGIEAALQAPFVIEPGLFNGRAGLVHVLALLSRLGLASIESERALAAHIDGFKLHALHHGIGIGFPGTGLLKISSDFATGAAGVLSALHGYSLLTLDDEQEDWSALLPLLLPRPQRPSLAPHDWTRRGGDVEP